MRELSGDGGADAVAAGPDAAGPRSLDRRPVLWGVTLLVLLAVLVIAVTIVLTDAPGSRPDQHIRLGIPTGPPAASRPGPPAASPARSSPPRDRHPAPTSRSARPAPRTSDRAPSRSGGSTAPVGPERPGPARAGRSTGAAAPVTPRPCPGPDACAVPGDHGVPAALNAARARRGVGPATLGVTAAAQQCAVAGGGCAGQVALAMESTADGAAAVADLLRSAGASWLVSGDHRAFAVGWAYHPGPGRYVVAILPA